jgi:hypothetical protein
MAWSAIGTKEDKTQMHAVGDEQLRADPHIRDATDDVSQHSVATESGLGCVSRYSAI